MTLRSHLTDIADRERRDAEAAVPHVRDPELVRQNFEVIAEYARKRIERLCAAERQHGTNGKADTAPAA